MKKVLFLLALVCTALVSTFTFSSCSDDELTGDVVVYLKTDCDNNNAILIIASLDQRMADLCDKVDENGYFFFSGEIESTRERAKAAFEKACKDWESSDEYNHSEFVYQGYNVMLIEVSEKSHEIARHKLAEKVRK